MKKYHHIRNEFVKILYKHSYPEDRKLLMNQLNKNSTQNALFWKKEKKRTAKHYFQPIKELSELIEGK
jgi:hypothetical protein